MSLVSHGDVAQLGEHQVRNLGVESSILFVSTIIDYVRRCPHGCLFFYSTINIHPHSGWFFIFGHSPYVIGGVQVRLLLACQPCIDYLPPINGSLGSNKLS